MNLIILNFDYHCVGEVLFQGQCLLYGGIVLEIVDCISWIETAYLLKNTENQRGVAGATLSLVAFYSSLYLGNPTGSHVVNVAMPLQYKQ